MEPTTSIEPIGVCFVCLGNICRSPTAEGIMQHLVEARGLHPYIHVDSAGTSAFHVGEPADRRSQQLAQRRGIQLTSISRQFARQDFDTFEYVIAMDRSNESALQRLAKTAQQRAKIRLLRSFDRACEGDLDVPDPYYGAGDGFGRVFDICMAGCEGLLEHLIATHGIRAGS